MPKRVREFVRYATLAANSHNTQPWRFRLLPGVIVIEPDAARRTPVVDPDDHHLWASLGCAVENLVQAAAAFGRAAEVELAGERIVVRLAPTAARRSPLPDAIVARQCTRSSYDGSRVDPAQLRTLQAATEAPGVRLLMIDDAMRREQLTGYVAQGVQAQMQDPRFVTELKAWIRFSDAETLATRDGLAARSSGNPALPRWLGSLMFGFVATPAGERDRYVAQLRSSSGVAVFVSERTGPEAFVAVGRAYQRFALQATALGLRNAFVNPPVEVPALREQLARWLGLDPASGARPSFIVRYGRAAAMPRSLRRPVDAVIV
jgi:nitroreductase